MAGDENEAIANIVKTLIKEGFDPEQKIETMTGNWSQILYQLEAYKSHGIKKAILLMQVLDK